MTNEQIPNRGVPTGPPPPPPPPPPQQWGHGISSNPVPPAQPQYASGPPGQHRYTHDGARLAGTGMRVAARLLDFVLIAIVSFIGGLISSTALSTNFDYDAYRTTSGVISLIISFGAIAYFLFAESLWGTTVGKLILGIKVRSVAGGQLSLGQAFKRNAFVLPMYLGAVVSSLVMLGSDQDFAGTMSSMMYGGTVGILGNIATVGLSIALIVSISNSPNLQGFHDKLADADVIATR